MAKRANHMNSRTAVPSSSRDVLAPKTGHLIARNLRRLIIRGELQEGDALPPETELLEQFQVSRPTLREALRVLESEGFVEVRRGAHGGARVHVPTEQAAARQIGFLLQHRGTTLSDVYEARVVLEAPAAGLAAKRRTASDLARLGALLQREEEMEGDAEAALEAHHDFHTAIVEMAGSKTIEIMSAMIETIVHEAIPAFVHGPVDESARRRLTRKAHRTHEALVQLVADRDATGAEQLWRKHLAEGGDAMLHGLSETSVLELLT